MNPIRIVLAMLGIDHEIIVPISNNAEYTQYIYLLILKILVYYAKQYEMNPRYPKLTPKFHTIVNSLLFSLLRKN